MPNLDFHWMGTLRYYFTGKCSVDGRVTGDVTFGSHENTD